MDLAINPYLPGDDLSDVGEKNFSSSSSQASTSSCPWLQSMKNASVPSALALSFVTHRKGRTLGSTRKSPIDHNSFLYFTSPLSSLSRRSSRVFRELAVVQGGDGSASTSPGTSSFLCVCSVRKGLPTRSLAYHLSSRRQIAGPIHSFRLSSTFRKLSSPSRPCFISSLSFLTFPSSLFSTNSLSFTPTSSLSSSLLSLNSSSSRFYGGSISPDKSQLNDISHPHLSSNAFLCSQGKGTLPLFSSLLRIPKATVQSLEGNEAACLLREVALQKAALLPSSFSSATSTLASLSFDDTSARREGMESEEEKTMIRLSQALLLRCYLDCQSLKAEAIVSILESVLLLRACSSKLLVALAIEIHTRLLKVASEEQLAVILSTYSFSYPVSALSSGFERNQRRPPETVENMLQALCDELARRLVSDGGRVPLSHSHKRNYLDGAGEEVTDSPPHQENEMKVVLDTSQERTMLREECLSTKTVAYAGRGLVEKVSRDGLVTAISALARLSLRTQEAKNLLKALQQALCTSFNALAQETRTGGTYQPQLQERKGQQSRQEVWHALYSLTCCCLSLREDYLLFVGQVHEAEESSALLVLEQCGTLAAALSSLRGGTESLVTLLAAESARAVRGLSGALLTGEKAEGASLSSRISLLETCSPARRSSSWSDVLSTSQSGCPPPLVEANDTAVGRAARTASRASQAIFKLCADTGQNGRELRQALWQLEQSTGIFLQLPTDELLRFNAAFHEEAASKLIRDYSGLGRGCYHHRGEEVKRVADVTDKSGPILSDQDTGGAQNLIGTSHQVASPLSSPFSAAPCSPGVDNLCPSFLFSLRYLPELAVAEDTAFDSLSPRLNLLLLFTLCKLSQGLRSIGKMTASWGTTDLASGFSAEPTNTNLRGKMRQFGFSGLTPPGNPSEVGCFDGPLWERLPSAARRACVRESSQGQKDPSTDEETLGENPEPTEQRATRHFRNAEETSVKASLAGQASETGRGSAQTVEDRLQAFAEALARSCVSRAVDCTISDIMLGLIAVARLEVKERTLPFSEQPWRQTPSFRFLAETFVRALNRRTNSGGVAKAIKGRHRVMLSRTLVDLGLTKQVPAEVFTREASPGESWDCDRVDSPEATFQGDSSDPLYGQSEEDSQVSRRAKLSMEQSYGGTEGVRKKVQRGLAFLDRTWFLDDEADLGNGNSSPATRGRGAPARLRRSGGHFSSSTDKHDDADWEAFATARPLVIDKVQEARILGLVQDSIKPGRGDSKGERLHRASSSLASLRSADKGDGCQAASDIDLPLASFSPSSSLLFDRRRGEYFPEGGESVSVGGEPKDAASQKGAATHATASDRRDAPIGNGYEPEVLVWVVSMQYIQEEREGEESEAGSSFKQATWVKLREAVQAQV
ncbi:hypothetical protein CSUI_003456 [Cystoisospora suis]|uniref:Uncharacterized protein n=1 Tax=Cystoisospora suis TaxID=483139 RepID=A0A2C6L4T6_9APIC|nr:hypothetical protein CSUI_003456 [Cystoisospora suis]